MANFQLYEDAACLVENVRPKNMLQPAKAFPAQAKKQRAALQQLCRYQQNMQRKQEVAKEKENDVPTRVEEKSLPNISKDLAVLEKIRVPVPVARPQHSAGEYDDDIWTYLNHLEKKVWGIRPCYMSKQVHLTSSMRSVLIDWLASVAVEYNMGDNIIHLGVNYLDRFLSNISVIREKFQLVGATAMMLAGKLEEIYPIDLKEWSYLTGDAFTVRQFIQMEQFMLKTLNFEMNTPTILDFLKHMCAKHRIDTKTMHLAMYLSELVLLEGGQYLQYFPSKLAAASLVLARHTLSKSDLWTKKFEETAGYTLKQLSPVVQKQQKTFSNSPHKEQQAIQKKYASVKYQRVALLKPRTLVLDETEE